MELIEYSDEQRLTREAAAQRLRDIADQLARHNNLEFTKDGRDYVISVPDQVNLQVEIEVGSSSEIEIEISW